tara:strand:- start:345 stop:731 length:387 start_codon:yes stop_codon:yes gene_type:complete
MNKDAGAFLTIGELASELGLPQHILRYWETRFPSLRPLQRAGNRRYYRPEDAALARRIHHLLTVEGYTVRGAQQALMGVSVGRPAKSAPPSAADSQGTVAPMAISEEERQNLIKRLGDIRAKLESALT